jgi:hypothetical protein
MCLTEASTVATYKLQRVAADATDEQLGRETVDALVAMSTLGKRAIKDLSPDLRRIQVDFPDIRDWSDLYDLVTVFYRPAQEAKTVTIDGRAAGIDEPNIVKVSVDSTDADIGGQLRKMFASLQEQRASASLKKRAPKKRAAYRSKSD